MWFSVFMSFWFFDMNNLNWVKLFFENVLMELVLVIIIVLVLLFKVLMFWVVVCIFFIKDWLLFCKSVFVVLESFDKLDVVLVRLLLIWLRLLSSFFIWVCLLVIDFVSWFVLFRIWEMFLMFFWLRSNWSWCIVWFVFMIRLGVFEINFWNFECFVMRMGIELFLGGWSFVFLGLFFDRRM